ncbi:MAG: deoxyribodipyrimidine photo-lyase [candidate division SR1 bacterium]|nr:deoxyribodipyrimidine photo-lyase [candidate division SR1 bacterium]
MTKQKLIIYWSRRDFRLLDNPALYNAVEKAKEEKVLFLPIYILDNALLGGNEGNIGYPRRFYLSKILSKFINKFDCFSVLAGTPNDIFRELSKHYDIYIYVNHDVESYSRKRDQEIADLIGSDKFFASKDQLTVPKDTISGSGSLYTVFSPFRNTVLQGFLKSVTFQKPQLNDIKYAQNISFDNYDITSLDLELKNIDKSQQLIFNLINKQWQVRFGKDQTISLDAIWNRPDYSNWYSSEDEAIAQFEDFVRNKILNYKENRDSLALDLQGNGQTSKMSLALKWGLISSRTIKEIVLRQHGGLEKEGVFSYISEIIWREFYKYILYNNPSVLDLEFQKRFQNNEIKWVDDKTALYRFEKWIKGETGYEVVDAAMHQIANTGWMHNRSRMIVASVLTKNLGVDWRWGQDYFRAVLLDLDEASNNGGWQWAASVGADPKPIRIFNPYLQQENYDNNKEYIRFWLPKNYNIHEPIVDHKQAREEALKRYGLGSKK